uniref:Uncharacterized protein n=1 Tax=Spermophilus dauricus TaxID=99837 RepID=A0A8C9QR73_SPEDA
ICSFKNPEKVTPFLSEAGFSGSIESSVLLFFFRACNTFMNDPSAFPTDASKPTSRNASQLTAPVKQALENTVFPSHPRPSWGQEFQGQLETIKALTEYRGTFGPR